MNLNDAKSAFLAHLEVLGKHPRTLYTYAKDLDYFIQFFGDDRDLASIRIPEMGKWLKSETYLNTTKGKPRSPHTLDKNLRVVRQLFVWAQTEGHIDNLPLPKSVPLGRSKVTVDTDEAA